MDFEALIHASVRQVSDAGGVALPVPADMAVRDVRDTRMTTIRMGIEGRAEFRAVLIEGKKVHIVNMFLWADPAVEAPSYAMEFVVFGPRPIVAVVDMVGLAGGESVEGAAEILRDAHERWPIVNGDDPPAWYQECRSGNDFFVRPNEISEVSRLEDLHTQVFGSALERCLRAPACAGPSVHQQNLVEYKTHHRENTPGRPWLLRSFGEAWTDAYLKGCVFA